MFGAHLPRLGFVKEMCKLFIPVFLQWVSHGTRLSKFRLRLFKVLEGLWRRRCSIAGWMSHRRLPFSHHLEPGLESFPLLCMTRRALDIVEKRARVAEQRGGLLVGDIAIVRKVWCSGPGRGFEHGLLGGGEGIDRSKGRTVFARAARHGLA